MAARKGAAKLDEKSDKPLPPARSEKKALRHDVSLPLQHTSLSTVVYSLGGIALLVLAYYFYLVTLWKAQAGGWVNLALGRSHPNAEAQAFGGTGATPKYETPAPSNDLEDRLTQLAEQLGIHPKELAAAIKPLLPPAKASAIEKDPSLTGTAVKALTATNAAEAAEPTKAGILDAVLGGEEPPTEV